MVKKMKSDDQCLERGPVRLSIVLQVELERLWSKRHQWVWQYHIEKEPEGKSGQFR